MGDNHETTTRFRVDISELKSAMQEAKRQISIANSEFKAATAGMSNWAKSTDGLKAKLTQLDSNLNSQKTILENLKRQYAQVAHEQGEGSAAAERLKIQINNQQATIGRTERSIRDYQTSLERAERAEEIANATGRDAIRVYDQLEREEREAARAEDALRASTEESTDSMEELADAEQNVGQQSESAGKGFTVMKGVLANLISDGIRKGIDALKDFARNAVSVGSDFEASMSEVASISGATGEQLELLTETAEKYGRSTQFSASEASQALKYMSLAGWDAEKSCNELGGVLNLAAASGMELADASDMVTNYLSAFSNTTMSATQFSDMLAYAQGHANTSAQQLGEAYKNCASNLNAAGQDTYTVTAMLEALANQGKIGAEAGTQVSAIMRDLTAKMKDGAIQIGDTSVQVQDAEGNFRDLTDIIKDVDTATQGMGDAQKASALKATFTSDSISGLNTILNEGIDNIAGYEEELRNSAGTAEEMAKTMNDNLAGDVKNAQSALEDLYITAYKEVQPTLRDMVQYATEKIIPTIKNEVIPAVKDFIKWIMDNKDEVVAGLVAIGTGLLAFNVVSTIQRLVSAFKAFKTAQEGATVAQWLLNTAMSANPIGILIAAITGLVAGFVYLWNTSDDFRQFWINLWESLKQGVSDAINAISTFFTQSIPEAFGSVIEWLSGFADDVGVFFTETIPQTISDFISSVAQSVRDFLNDIGLKIAQGFVDFNNAVEEGIQKAINFIAELPEKIAYFIGFAIGSVVKFGVDLYKFATTEIPKFVDKTIDFIATLPTRFWEWLKKTYQKVKEWGTNSIKTAGEIGSNFVSKTIEFISTLPSKIWSWFKNTLEKVTSWGSNMKQKAGEAGSSFVNNMINFVSKLPSNIWNWFSQTISKAIAFKNDIGNRASEAARNIFNNLVNGISGLPRKFGEIGDNIVKGLWNGIKNAGNWIKNKVADFAGSILQGAKDALGIHSPSRKFEHEVGENIALGLIKGINNKKENCQKSARELADIYVSEAKTKVDQLKKIDKISEADTIAYWQEILKHTQRGTAAYVTAFENLYEAKKTLNANITTLDTQYKKDSQEVKDKLVKDIQSVTDAYDKAVKDRASSINSSISTFEKFEQKEAVSKQDLLKNMQGQAKAVKEWNNVLTSLSNRKGMNENLLKELESKGVDYLGTLKEIDNMDDTELEKYIKAYEAKNKAAMKRAKAENADLKAESEEKIKNLVTSAEKELKSLEDTYNEKLKKLGVSIKKQSKNIGTSIIDSINAGIKQGSDSLMKNVKSLCTQTIKQVKKELGVSTKKAKSITANSLSNVVRSDQIRSNDVRAQEKQISYTFNQINNSPEALNRLEIYRQTQNLLGYVRS